MGYAVAQLVGALRYKSEGRGFDSRRNTFALWPLGLTQPLTEMNTRNNSWWVKAAGADCNEIWEPEHPGTLRDCPGL
jgi:hypothetical protein